MLFCCDECGCVDDSELTHPLATPLTGGQFLCTACRPVVIDSTLYPGEWHGRFPKELYDPAVDLVCNRPTGVGFS